MSLETLVMMHANANPVGYGRAHDGSAGFPIGFMEVCSILAFSAILLPMVPLKLCETYVKTSPASRRSKTVRSQEPPDLAGAEHVIDFSRYVPTLLSSLVAKLRANANVFFSESYGVSLMEWRILSFLKEHGPVSAYDIWTKAYLDKAAVSRGTGSLRDKGLLRIVSVKDSARNRTKITLSPAGAALLDRSFDEVVRRHDNLTAGLDAKSVETFLEVLRHLEQRIPHMADKSGSPDSLYGPVKRIEKPNKPR